MDVDNLDTPIMVASRKVACDGGGGPLGHPRVFLTMDDDDRIVCPYCSRTYVFLEGAGEAHEH